MYAFWLVLTYDLLEDTRRWQPSIQVWQLSDSLNQSQFFAKRSNQSVPFILYRQ